MKNFDSWLLQDFTPPKELEEKLPHPELDGCCEADGSYYYPCVVCTKSTLVDEPEFFDPDMHYCGGSPWCCP